jgi:hypothetical protein
MSIAGGALKLDLGAGECLIPNTSGTCITPTDRVSEHVRDYLRSIPEGQMYANMDMASMCKALEEILNVDTEAGIWEHPQFRKFVGAQLADHVLNERYKQPGPADSTALLDNNNIDDTLGQWSKYSGKLFGKKFLHLPFQMIDFRKTRSELSYLDLEDLINKKYDSFGVVLNTDVSSGKGKHWFCLYGDLKHMGTKEDPYRLEYFNSSGNPPLDEVAMWLEQSCHDLLKKGIHCEIVRSVPRRLQNSQTECGMWSLLYIRSRLEGKPPSWFYTCKTNDRDMIAYRKKVFRSVSQ